MTTHSFSFLPDKHSWQHTPSPFFWAYTRGSTFHFLSSGSTLTTAHSISFLLGPHSWQHIPFPFFWVHTHGTTFHFLSSGSTLMTAHSISFLLGPHSWQHTPFPFFWVHTHGSTFHFLSSGSTLMTAHSISFLLGPHSWQHTHPRFGSTSVAAHQFLCLNDRTFFLALASYCLRSGDTKLKDSFLFHFMLIKRIEKFFVRLFILPLFLLVKAQNLPHYFAITMPRISPNCLSVSCICVHGTKTVSSTHTNCELYTHKAALQTVSRTCCCKPQGLEMLRIKQFVSKL